MNDIERAETILVLLKCGEAKMNLPRVAKESEAAILRILADIGRCHLDFDWPT